METIMTISHRDYVADKDEAQLRNLIAVANSRLEELTSGGWVWLWVVADNANQGWFADEDYEGAVALLEQLGRKAIASRTREELSIERRQYRAFEAARLVKDTQEELAAQKR